MSKTIDVTKLLGKSVSFELYSDVIPIITDDFSNCKIDSILSSDTARKFIDVESRYAAVSPVLPKDKPLNDISTMLWVQVLFPTGNTSIIAYDWINTDTLDVRQDITIQVTVSNVTLADKSVIEKILKANNFPNVSLNILK